MFVARDLSRLAADMTEAAREAGAIAHGYFRDGAQTTAAVEFKHGGSPVTAADYAVDRFLAPRLSALAPDAGLLSEERLDDRDRLNHRAVFIVDPIDGTRAFVRGDPRWAVSIALVVDREPVAAALHLPALDLTFVAAQNQGATLNGKKASVSNHAVLDGARISGPVSLVAALQRNGLHFETQPRVPSLAFRIAQVADGSLDVGLASTNACDWDIAAADLILREAGGVLFDVAGARPQYNAPDPRHGVLAATSQRLAASMVEALQALRVD